MYNKQKYALFHNGEIIKTSINYKKLKNILEQLKKGEDEVVCKPKLTPDLINIIINDYELHLSVEKVANKHKISKKVIKRILNENGIKTHSNKGPRTIKEVYIHSAYILLKRSNKGLTSKKLAELMFNENIAYCKYLKSSKLAKILTADKRFNVTKIKNINYYSINGELNG